MSEPQSSVVKQEAVTWDAEAVKQRRAALKRIFITLTLLQIIINLDGGAVPAALLHIDATFELTPVEIGLVGMLVYQGVAIGCLFVGPALRVMSPVMALRITLALNICATFGFGASVNVPMLLIFRFMIGFLQALPAVYFPVWVDEFAPEDATAGWMAGIQTGGPLGICIGYVFCGSLSEGEVGKRCMPDDLTCRWRYAFYLQSCVLVGFAIASFCIPPRLFDLGQPRPPSELETAAGAEAQIELHPDLKAGSSAPGAATVSAAAGEERQSFFEAVRESFSNIMIDALQPLCAAPPINAEHLHTATTETKEREQRVEARIRRMSTKPNLTLSAADRGSQDGMSQADGGSPMSPGGQEPQKSQSGEAVDGDRASAPASIPVRVSKARLSAAGMRYSMSRNSTARVSTRAQQRLTLTDPDQVGRPRVVSLLDALTAPQDQYDTHATRGRTASMGAPNSSPAPGRFKPTLARVESSRLNIGSPAAAPAPLPAPTAVDAIAEVEARPHSAIEPAEEPAEPRGNPVCRLMRNGVYVFTVLALCSLFFVVTGIQFWVTMYIVVVIGKSQLDVTPAFGVTSILAPVLGVLFGGAFIDKIGGYKGDDAMALTLKCCFAFAICAAGAAIACAYVPLNIVDNDNDPDRAFWACIALIAVTLMFGGAIVPAATGCIVAAVDPSLRQISSAASMFLFQQLGYAASPILSAVVAQAIAGDDPKPNLEAGFKFVMWMAAGGVINLFVAWRLAERRASLQPVESTASSGSVKQLDVTVVSNAS